MNVIESDSDFDTKNLYDMDVEELDKMEDKRPSPFWKMSWAEVFARLLLWALAVYIGENNYLNPHHENFVGGFLREYDLTNYMSTLFGQKD